MAEIEVLEAHQEPPETEDWIMVDRGAAGGFYVHHSLADAKEGGFFGTSVALATKSAALELAQKLASKHGCDTIYTKGI